MTREEAIAYIKSIKNGLHETGKDFPYRDEIIPVAKDALEMAIKALEQEPCEDAVSRRAVNEIINDAYYLKLDDGAALQESIHQLPSVTPQPKMGQWEWIFDVSEETPVSPEEIEYAGWGCSICHNPPDDICDWDDPNDPPTHKYCPNCGAKMENEI